MFPGETREKWFLLISCDNGKFLPAFPFVHKLRDYTGMHKNYKKKNNLCTKVLWEKVKQLSRKWDRRDALTEQFRQ